MSILNHFLAKNVRRKKYKEKKLMFSWKGKVHQSPKKMFDRM